MPRSLQYSFSALLIPVQFEPLEQIAEAFAFVAPFDDIGRSGRQDQFFRHKRLKFYKIRTGRRLMLLRG